MSNIYDTHAAAFRGVSAFAVLKDGKEVARITCKSTYTGARGENCRAFVWFLGSPMVEGRACGGGYDVEAGAVSAAASKMVPGGLPIKALPIAKAFRDACALADSGRGIKGALADAGFLVLEVI